MTTCFYDFMLFLVLIKHFVKAFGQKFNIIIIIIIIMVVVTVHL